MKEGPAHGAQGAMVCKVGLCKSPGYSPRHPAEGTGVSAASPVGTQCPESHRAASPSGEHPVCFPVSQTGRQTQGKQGLIQNPAFSCKTQTKKSQEISTCSPQWACISGMAQVPGQGGRQEPALCPGGRGQALASLALGPHSPGPSPPDSRFGCHRGRNTVRLTDNEILHFSIMGYITGLLQSFLHSAIASHLFHHSVTPKRPSGSVTDTNVPPVPCIQ